MFNNTYGFAFIVMVDCLCCQTKWHMGITTFYLGKYTLMPTLPDYLGVFWIQNESPSILYSSPTLPDKSKFEYFSIKEEKSSKFYLQIKTQFIQFSFQGCMVVLCESLFDFGLHASNFSDFQFVGGDWVKVQKVVNLGGWGGIMGFEGVWGGGGDVIQNQTSPGFRFLEASISKYVLRKFGW